METRYRYGFLARYLRQFVLEKMDVEGWQQRDVAAWLGMPDHALSAYLNRHSLPSTERRRQLLRLGCDRGELLEAAAADRLEGWMRHQDVSSRQVRRCLHRILAYEQRLQDRYRVLEGDS